MLDITHANFFRYTELELYRFSMRIKDINEAMHVIELSHRNLCEFPYNVKYVNLKLERQRLLLEMNAFMKQANQIVEILHVLDPLRFPRYFHC